MSFNKLINRIENIEIGHFDSPEVRAACRHIKKYSVLSQNKILSELHKNKGKKLLDMINRMLEQPFIEYRYVSYYLTLLRHRWLLKQAVYKKVPEFEEVQEYFIIASEICAVDEIVKGYEYLCKTIKRNQCEESEDYKNTYNYEQLCESIKKINQNLIL